MNTVKKLLFMLMLTAGCADLHGVTISYGTMTGARKSFKFDDADIGNKTWLEVLQEQLGVDQTFKVIIEGQLFDLNQTITQEHINLITGSSFMRIMITPSTPLVAETAAAAANTAAAAAQPAREGDAFSSICDNLDAQEGTAAAQPVTTTTAPAAATADTEAASDTQRATAKNKQAQADAERLLERAIQAQLNFLRGKGREEAATNAIDAVLATFRKDSDKDAMRTRIQTQAQEQLDAERSLLKTFNTFTRYAPSAFAATVLAVVAYRYNFASNFFGFIKNLVTKRATKLLPRN